MKHTNKGETCPSCEEKLKDAHPEMAHWFRTIVKPKFQDCHISWTFRNEKSQNEAVAMGKSKLAWPMSPHNKCDDEGNPCSLAIDVFKLCSNGMASWEWKYCQQISDVTKAEGFPFRWGGEFKTLKDYDHFELSEA